MQVGQLEAEGQEDALKLIQRQSMDLRKSIQEIGEAVLLAGEFSDGVD